MKKEHQILLVDDDPGVAELIRLHIENLGYDLVVATDGEEGLELARNRDFAALLLDWNLPSMEGIDICRAIRGEKPALPVLMLTARSEQLERILGLEMGADDYLVKPFNPRELVSRIKAVMRRINVSETGSTSETSPRATKVVQGRLEIDPETREVICEGAPVRLTAKEFDLLLFLASNPGRVYSREELLREVWDYDGLAYETVVTSFISRVRTKIEPNPESPKYIGTYRGVGYKFLHQT